MLSLNQFYLHQDQKNFARNLKADQTQHHCYTGLYSNGAKSGLLLNFGQNFSGLGGDKTSLKTTFKAAAETNTLNEELKLTAVLEAGILSFTSL